MNTVHAANWPRIVQTMAWYCDLNHGSAIDDTPETFFTETAWREHMMNVELHRKYSEQPTPSQPTHSQLETLSIQKQKQAPREKGSCPFCADIPEEIRKSRAPMSLDNDPRLIRHISTHIHSLSFFTFRFLDYTAVPEDEQVSDSSKVSTIQVMLKPRELLTPSERGDDLARVSLTFFDNNDKSVRSSKKDHMYIKERRYIDDDFELDEQDPFTTLRHYVPDDEQEGASWDFLPARKIEIKAVDEAFRTWTSKRLLCHFCDHIRNMDARGLMCPRCNHRFTEVITAENNTTSSQSASTPHLDNRKDVDFRTSLLGRVDWSSNFSNAGDLTVTSQDYLDPEYNPDQHSWHLEPDDESGSWESPPQADVPFTSTDEDLKNWNSRRHLTADEVPRGRDEFHIALICTLPVVYDAILLLLDQAYDDEDLDYGRAPSDPYSYATGCISGHHVVLVLGFQTTTGSLGAGLRSSFKNLKLALTVGICGGVPVIQIADPRKRDLFLGDVVISSQVLQLDFGQHVADAFQIKTDNLPVVEEARSHAIHDLLQNEFKSEVLWASFLEKSMKHLKEIQQKAVEEDYVTHYERPDPLSDIFFAPGNSHMHCNDCAACAASTGLPCGAAHSDSCEELGCDKAENVSSKGRVIARRRQYHPMEGDLRVFHGRIGTAHQVIKSGLTRDKLAAQYELMAFVPEEVASYLEVPHIVVSGVSDYSDSHRPPKAWQAFAAAAAVAVTKTLLQPCKLVDAVVNGVSDHSDSHKSKIWQSYAPATATTVAKELLQTHRLDADDLVTDSAPRSRVVSEAEFSVGKGVMVRKGDKSK
ncbi:hypothetical protein F5X68DRAFT_240155 [Plectosphaerella plurivora]|uniref:Nucleoside phosphorylase domain-containing protein n=1 Tax=Plectosphaerella plurivora TaxID=936078 RepID=A0A9P8VBA6_9PEZI|nr:hypothetical protein F5X68DRAFT_240155 [Plectosphaerella plurivora]